MYWFWIIVSIFTSSLISYYSIPTYTLDNYDAVVDDILTIVLFIPSISILVSMILRQENRHRFFYRAFAWWPS